MKPVLRAILIVGVAVVATFIATAAYYNQSVSKQVLLLMIAEAVQMEAYNDIGRVEAYDTVEDFIRRGCVKEALQLVQVQQNLLLGGIAYRMGESDDVQKVVLARSAAVAERARAQAAQRRMPDVPRCS